MRNTTEQNITAPATDRFSKCPDPRLREVVDSLVRHLHAFIREVEPTEGEWFAGIDFLTRVAQDVRRQASRILRAMHMTQPEKVETSTGRDVRRAQGDRHGDFMHGTARRDLAKSNQAFGTRTAGLVESCA